MDSVHHVGTSPLIFFTKIRCLMIVKSGIVTRSKRCLFDPHFSDRAMRFARPVECADRIARYKTFLKPTASHHPRKHTLTHYNSSNASLIAADAAAAAAHSESAWNINFSMYRHPMATVGIIDYLFAAPLLLLLCLHGRLWPKSNAKTATMKQMGAARAPNEFARGKARQRGVLERSQQLDADRPPRTCEHDTS